MLTIKLFSLDSIIIVAQTNKINEKRLSAVYLYLKGVINDALQC